jgi:hypothetical protein
MSDDNEQKPGHFTSELDDYPGTFNLPHPFLDRHMRVWWQIAIRDIQGMSEADFAVYDAEWKAAVELIRQFGAWDIDNVPVGDLDSDSVPMAVKQWVIEVADIYIYPFLPPRIRRRVRGIM